MRVLALTNMYPYPGIPFYGSYVKESLDLLRELDVEVDVLFINGKLSKLNYLKGIGQLRQRIRTHPYDLIHAHYVFSGAIALFQRKYPVVLTHHGIEVLQGYQSLLAKFVTPRMDRVIVRSQEMKQKLKADGAYIIPAGIDFDLFKPMPREEARKRLDLPGDRNLVLFAGAIRPEKRLEIIESAVSLLKREDPSLELVVASRVTHDVMPLYMNACDVLVLASVAEGSPNVIKEAMACNLPIVSVPVGDVVDVIGKTAGCFICEGTPGSIADGLRQALGFEGRTHGRERLASLGLESREVARRIKSVYEELLESRRGGRAGDSA